MQGICLLPFHINKEHLSPGNYFMCSMLRKIRSYNLGIRIFSLTFISRILQKCIKFKLGCYFWPVSMEINWMLASESLAFFDSDRGEGNLVLFCPVFVDVPVPATWQGWHLDIFELGVGKWMQMGPPCFQWNVLGTPAWTAAFPSGCVPLFCIEDNLAL